MPRLPRAPSTWESPLAEGLQRTLTGPLEGLKLTSALEYILAQRRAHRSTFVRSLPAALAWAGQQPWHTDIAWPAVLSVWADRLRGSAYPERTRRLNDWVDIVRTFPQNAHVATVSYHRLGLSNKSLDSANSMLDKHAYYVAMGHLVEIGGPSLLMDWLTCNHTHELNRGFAMNTFGCNALPFAIIESTLPMSLKKAFFYHHAIPAMWLSPGNKTWLSQITQEEPLATRLRHVPLQGASSSGYVSINRALVSTYFPELSPSLEMVVPESEWTKQDLIRWMQSLDSGANLEPVALPAMDSFDSSPGPF
jgi:hypothetical protein